MTAECYRFGGHYRPLRIPGHEVHMAFFDSFVPPEWIKEVVPYLMPLNEYVQEGKEEWWTELSVYDDEKLL